MAKRKPISKKQLRLRIFAGPNGSGKTTIINSVRAAKVNDKLIDFGNYINADDITRDLSAAGLPLSRYKIKVSKKRLTAYADASGLFRDQFTPGLLRNSLGFCVKPQQSPIRLFSSIIPGTPPN